MSEELKRSVGRPRKVATKPEPTPKKNPEYKMKAKPNWETFTADEVDTPDRLRIDPSLIPEGMSAVWVTDSVYGQGVPQHRAEFEKKGWTPVHQEDFDGQFNGMFMPKGAPGEINVEGMVLMMRPKEITDKAKILERRKANEQVAIKEQAFRSGDMPISLDPRHETAVRTNRINKSIERISIPEE
jgi:hypothetical protein